MVRTSLLRTLQILFRHKWLILTFFMVTVGLINLASYVLPPIYKATAQFLVIPGNEQLPIYTSSNPVADRVPPESLRTENIISEMQLLQARPVIERVVDRLNLDHRPSSDGAGPGGAEQSGGVRWLADGVRRLNADIHDFLLSLDLITAVDPRERAITALQKSLQVAPVFSSNVFSLTYMDDDAKLAAAVVNATAEEYLDYRQDVYKPPGAVDHFREVLEQRRSELDSAREHLRTYQDKYDIVNLEAEIDNNLRLLEDAKKGGAFNTQRDQYAARLEVLRNAAPVIRDLRFEVDNAQQLYERYAQKFDEVTSNAELDKSKFANVRLIEPAAEDDAPVFPHRLVNLILSLILGALGGVGLAFVANYFSDKVNAVEEMESPSMRALGSVPLLTRRRERRRAFAAERCRQACSVITEQLRTPGGARGLVLRGTGSGVGCSTMAVGLALALADEPQERILLVDANVNRPWLHEAFEMEDPPLRKADLAAINDLRDLIRRTDHANVDLLTAGRFQALQRSDPQVMQRLLEQLSSDYTFVLVDSPPLFSAASALKAVEGWAAIVVVAARRTSIQVVRRAAEVLQRQGFAVLGGVLNKRHDSLPDFIYRRL